MDNKIITNATPNFFFLNVRKKISYERIMVTDETDDYYNE